MPGSLRVEPRHRQLLAENGLTTPEAVMDLSGEVVCGHADRHVRRVTLTSHDGDRVAYLKREHTAGVRARWANAVRGRGLTSRAAAEARTLLSLEAADLPAPRVIAHGEDAAGRAFLLVEGVTDATELRDYLSETRDRADRAALAQQLGETLARLRQAGWATPELAAKHVLVRPGPRVTLLDWQSATCRATPVPLAECLRPLAALLASLGGVPLSARECLTVLRILTRGDANARLAPIAREVLRLTSVEARRSRVRDQRQGAPARLVWLAGEEMCVVADHAADWPTGPFGQPFYAETPPPPQPITVASGPATLARFRTNDLPGRILAWLRERPWRSPGAEAGRILVHLARHGLDAPELIAFGQRLTSVRVADSFVVWRVAADFVPLADVCRHDHDEWAALGEYLRRLHDAGLRLLDGHRWHDALGFAAGGPCLATPLAVGRHKNLTHAARLRQLALLVRPLPEFAAEQVRAGYALPQNRVILTRGAA